MSDTRQGIGSLDGSVTGISPEMGSSYRKGINGKDNGEVTKGD
jgi:hypothetical protein